MDTLCFHPLADIFPLLHGPAFDELLEDIRENGQVFPILVRQGRIIDGRNRYRACQWLDIEPLAEEWKGDEADLLPFIVSLNLHRRHLDDSQRAMVAAKLANMKHGGDRKTDQAANWPLDLASKQSDHVPVTQEHAARLLNVGERSVRRARAVLDDGAPELVHSVEQGELAVSTAAIIAAKPKEEQREIVARGRDEILSQAKAIRTEKARENAERRAEIAAQAVAVPQGRYRCVVIDPPWPMEKIERDVRPNQVGFDYPTMNEDALRAFPLADISADDCHLYLWTTQKFLPTAFRLLDEWGFRYVFTMVWHKPGGPQPFGLPQYNCEFVLFGRKGSLKFLDLKAFPTCFQAPRREHSRKPEEFYSLAARVSPGPRIDVFSREAHEGFDQHGNEVGKFAEMAGADHA